MTKYQTFYLFQFTSNFQIRINSYSLVSIYLSWNHSYIEDADYLWFIFLLKLSMVSVGLQEIWWLRFCFLIGYGLNALACSFTSLWHFFLLSQYRYDFCHYSLLYIWNFFFPWGTLQIQVFSYFHNCLCFLG